MKTVFIEDHGQDFLEWDLDETGKIVACRPFQQWVWGKFRVLNHEELEKGGPLIIHEPGQEMTTLNYPVESIVNH